MVFVFLYLCITMVCFTEGTHEFLFLIIFICSCYILHLFSKSQLLFNSIFYTYLDTFNAFNISSTFSFVNPCVDSVNTKCLDTISLLAVNLSSTIV